MTRPGSGTFWPTLRLSARWGPKLSKSIGGARRSRLKTCPENEIVHDPAVPRSLSRVAGSGAGAGPEGVPPVLAGSLASEFEFQEDRSGQQSLFGASSATGHSPSETDRMWSGTGSGRTERTIRRFEPGATRLTRTTSVRRIRRGRGRGGGGRAIRGAGRHRLHRAGPYYRPSARWRRR